MQKLNVHLEYCYGIKAFDHEFDFRQVDHYANAYAIYAPNGYMKTSLAKTFDDIAKERDSQDHVYPNRPSIRRVTDENGTSIQADRIFVMEPFNHDFTSEKTSLLLVNKDIKQQYDNALRAIDERQEKLVKKLKQLSGLTGRTVTPESEMLECFSFNSLHDLLESLEPQVSAGPAGKLATIVYAQIFNDRTKALLESGELNSQLAEYIEKYNELVNDSPILSKQFNHYNANHVHKTLADSGFFSANHSVNLNNGEAHERIDSAAALAQRIEGEKQRIFADPGLQKKFDNLDTRLSANAELRKFRDYLFTNRDVIPHLQNPETFQRDIWVDYLRDQQDLFNDWLEEYRHGKEVIKAAAARARSERTDWEEVVAVFNRRFSVPFTVTVSNQDDVILHEKAPQLSFVFRDETPQAIEQKRLLEVLSEGERRALHILHILFEITARQKQGLQTILVIDDIADSFDYKNKYAIVQYLKEIAESGLFYCIFLSHNFDFHRTLVRRLPVRRERTLQATKVGQELGLSVERYQNNPFKTWRNRLAEPLYQIAAIPMVRNLAEYCGNTSIENRLTALLHIKPDTTTITRAELQTMYREILADRRTLAFDDGEKPVIDTIFEVADAVVRGEFGAMELESKVVLSMAIRLKAEQYMLEMIADPSVVDGITSNQTPKLINIFKDRFSDLKEAIDLLDQVNLMTPENIHLNSFMYEPILDMDPQHLQSLHDSLTVLAMSSTLRGTA